MHGIKHYPARCEISMRTVPEIRNRPPNAGQSVERRPTGKTKTETARGRENTPKSKQINLWPDLSLKRICQEVAILVDFLGQHQSVGAHMNKIFNK